MMICTIKERCLAWIKSSGVGGDDVQVLVTSMVVLNHLLRTF